MDEEQKDKRLTLSQKLAVLRHRIDWFERTVEVIVVFIGLTAALFLTTWRDNAKDNQLAQKYIHNFSIDMQQDSTKINKEISRREIKLERVSQVLEIMTNVTLVPDSALSVIGDVMEIASITPTTITFETIKSSGNFNLISDFDLRQNIIEYYKNYEDLIYAQKVLNDYVNQYGIPFVFNNLDMLSGEFTTSKESYSRPFKNIVAGYSGLLQQILDRYKEMKTMNQELLTKLEALLEE